MMPYISAQRLRYEIHIPALHGTALHESTIALLDRLDTYYHKVLGPLKTHPSHVIGHQLRCDMLYDYHTLPLVFLCLLSLNR